MLEKYWKNHIESQPDLVDCPYKRCKTYGETLNCYMDLYHNCEIYTHWRYVMDMARELKRRKSKDLGML